MGLHQVVEHLTAFGLFGEQRSNVLQQNQEPGALTSLVRNMPHEIVVQIKKKTFPQNVELRLNKSLQVPIGNDDAVLILSDLNYYM